MSDHEIRPFNTPVAVFPLPNTAVVPGETIALHLFEPRYRTMINDVLKNDYLLGVALAGKVLHDPELHLGDDPRARNDKLYEPNAVFGCGTVELKHQYPDGRAEIELHVHHKVEIVKILQTLPYYLAQVSPIEDQRSQAQEEALLVEELKNELHHLVQAIDVNAANAIENQAKGLELRELNALILGLIRFPGEFKQLLLEQELELNRGQILLTKLPELFPRNTH